MGSFLFQRNANKENDVTYLRLSAAAVVYNVLALLSTLSFMFVIALTRFLI